MMRSLTTWVAAGALFLLLAGPAAASPQGGAGGDLHGAWPGGARVAIRTVDPRADYAPLGARLSATAVVGGTVYDSHGVAVDGGTVQCDSLLGDRWYFVSGTTDAAGNYEVEGVRPSSDGRLIVFPDNDTRFVQVDSWPDAGTYTRGVYPGRVALQAARGGRWGDFSSVTVDLMGPGVICTNRVGASTTTTPVLADLEALSATYQGGAAYFFWDEGLEFDDPITVTMGAASPDTISINEADAQRVWCSSPFWYSGSPGSTVKLALQGYPTGWLNRVTGFSDDAEGSLTKTYGTFESKGTATHRLSLKVPASAKPGYTYWFNLQHVDGAGEEGALYLKESYQVCTMKPSRRAIKKGARIRVTGVVPTAGRWGSETGLKKKVTLYGHNGRVSVPTIWNPKSKGWFKIADVRTNGRGAYTTRLFKPRKTLTLVVRYPGDDWYYGAYTSAQTVTVR